MILYDSEMQELKRRTAEFEKLREEWSEATFKAHELREKKDNAKRELFRTVVNILDRHWQYRCPKCKNGYMDVINTCLNLEDGVACMECRNCNYRGPLFPSKYDAVWHWLVKCNEDEDDNTTIPNPDTNGDEQNEER